ncbi:MAG TPA: T9SS type A sorting domain-containing protein, partial [Chitinophagaceae bacterium]|nr:T9SS type A sorting domain-containing protein [Chitinophagaceae bacterium]
TANILVSAPGLVPQNLIVTQDLGTTAVSNIQNPLIKIYPNPAKDVLYIDGFSGNAQLSLYDVTGKLLFTQFLTQRYVNITNLPGGIYLLKITEKKNVTIKKLLILN